MPATESKINAANAFGGPGLAMQTVNALLGAHISDYVLVSFSGFEKIVNTLGGVTLDVKTPMYYRGGPNTDTARPAKASHPAVTKEVYGPNKTSGTPPVEKTMIPQETTTAKVYGSEAG